MDLYYYLGKAPFKQKHLLTLQDYTADEIRQVLSLALRLKDHQQKGIDRRMLAGKTLAMIFAKSSTRTRVSFDVGIHQLGGYGLMLPTSQSQMGRGEPPVDTANVLSRYVDGIMIRTYHQHEVEALAKHSSVPVINGLTDLVHPCQALADIMTLYEKKGDPRGLKLAYCGDGNNVANSLLTICSKLGIDIAIACPHGYEPNAAILRSAYQNAMTAGRSGSHIVITDDPMEAVKDADAVYTDVFTSMGQEDENDTRQKVFAPYQVNHDLMEHAKDDAIFMHDLPAHRGEEVTAEIIDGEQSVIYDQAENRLHAQKAVMALLMA